MSTNPNQPVDPVITVEQFNKQMKEWTYRVRYRIRGRLQQGTVGSSGKGSKSIAPSFKYDFGEIYSTGFKFSYYLVFVHYGVGRGYIRQGSSVVRGRRVTDGNRKNDKRENYYTDNRAIARRPWDWADTEIKKNVDKLADIVAAYHGDKAAANVLKDSNKLLIEK